MQQRFQNKTVLVTGGAKGIGRACAEAFAREGGRVVIADVDREVGPRTAGLIEAAGGAAVFVPADVARAVEVQGLVASAVAAFGGVDVLCNNAGVVRYGSVVELSAEDWDYQLNINLKATFLACKYTIPEMIKRGGGAIVNLASAQAFASQKGVAAYAASKGAIVSFTTAVALDHAADNIRCNCVAPGTIHTPMLDWGAAVFNPEEPARAIAEWGKLHPLGRVGQPEEVARLVLFLASDDASFCTGGCHRVDGGLLSVLI